MKHYYLSSSAGTRMWHAEDFLDALLQHLDAFPEEQMGTSMESDEECPNPDQPELCG